MADSDDRNRPFRHWHLCCSKRGIPPKGAAVRKALTRARRFPLQLPMLFRAGAGERWRKARTLGIGRDGLSFSSRNKLTIGTLLDMRFFVGRKPMQSEVECRGRIVRQKLDRTARTYAATIDSYRFTRMAPSGRP
ncbi:MAG TPA: PilZ domain-containing protein [Vicinamibacterales bacterium]